MWKDFFYFTKTERQGIIVLVVLILGVCATSKLLSSAFTEEDIDENDNFEKEYNEFITSLQEVKQAKKYPHNYRYPYAEKEILLTPFDPNTADSTTFLTLGLPPWMIKNILRYRAKQGKFRHPDDFKKIYGLTDEQYHVLLPYIRIVKDNIEKDTTRLFTEYKEKRDTLFKYQTGTIIDLNNADTTELKKIPGVGSGIARMIVNYRKRLGGFYQIEQLKEIHLKVEKLRSWFSVNTNSIARINLNKASIEHLMYHPYINYYQAKVIVEYRKKKGKLNSLKQLSLYEEFTPSDFERIHPYICFE